MQQRLHGLDVARALAISGMVAVHVGPLAAGGLAGGLIDLAYGRASVLFVLLAGLGVGLLTRRSTDLRRDVLLWRAGLLFVVGLALQHLAHGAQVILPTYALLFLLAALAAKLPGWSLLAASVALAIGGPLVWIAANNGNGAAPRAPQLTDAPSDILSSLLVTGPYPLVVWAAPFFLGMWLGRRDLRCRSVQRRMIVAGIAAAGGALLLAQLLLTVFGEPAPEPGLHRLISAVGHSQMPFWLISSTGASLVVVAVLLLPPRMPRALMPWALMGQLALTVYVIHLLILAAFVPEEPATATTGLLITTAIVAGAIAASWLWRRFFTLGPLEAAIRRPPWRAGFRRRVRHEQ